MQKTMLIIAALIHKVSLNYYSTTVRLVMLLLQCFQLIMTLLYIHTHIFVLKKVDKRNLNRESYIDMDTVNYLGLVQIQIHIYSSGHME